LIGCLVPEKPRNLPEDSPSYECHDACPVSTAQDTFFLHWTCVCVAFPPSFHTAMCVVGDRSWPIPGRQGSFSTNQIPGKMFRDRKPRSLGPQFRGCSQIGNPAFGAIDAPLALLRSMALWRANHLNHPFPRITALIHSKATHLPTLRSRRCTSR
jgi:hypothetical protein